MDIFNQDDQRTILDVLRRAEFNDAARVFSSILAAAHSQGEVEGSERMGKQLLEKLDAAMTPAPDTTELERGIRASVLAKFRPRGDLPDASA